MSPLDSAGPTVHYVDGGLERTLLNKPNGIGQLVSETCGGCTRPSASRKGSSGQGALAVDDLDMPAHRSVMQRGLQPRQIIVQTGRFMQKSAGFSARGPRSGSCRSGTMSDWSLDELGHCVFGGDLTRLSEAIHNQFRQTIRQTLAAMVDVEAETPKPSAKERFEQMVTELDRPA
nr:hypothetical protein [Streptomyces antimycoticus]